MRKRNVAKENPGGGKSTPPEQKIHGKGDDDHFENIFTRPHTLAGLLAGVSFVTYSAFFHVAETFEDGVANGLLCSSALFVLYCALQMSDGLLIRPHPIVWRAVQGVAILYLEFLVFLLMQDVVTARSKIMPFFDRSLGEIPEANTKMYADDCRINTPEDPGKGWDNLYGSTVDIFSLAHVLGWFAKALLMRDLTLCFVLSILWELLEVSLQHLLPNFKECWWDHYLLDFAGCNLIGMVCGLWVCNRMSALSYNWTGVSHITTARGKVARALKQFTPFSWTEYTWEALSSFTRLFQVLCLCGAAMTLELNSFFLKHVLWIPPECPWNTFRLVLMWSLALPAVREYYAYIGPGVHKMGSSLWLMVAILTVESLVWVKMMTQDPQVFSRGSSSVHVPSPELVGQCWAAAGVLFLLWTILYFNVRHSSTVVARFFDLILALSFAPLAYLLWVDFADTFYSGPPQ